MKRAVMILAAVDVVLALVIAALLLFSDGAKERFWEVFGRGDKGEDSAVVAGQQDASGDQGGRADSAGDAARKGKKGAASKLDKAALQAMIKAGRIDEAEVERRVAEILETKKRTIEVKRAEEERRIGEVVDWFNHLMAHHPESGQKAREIMNEYIELRYATYGDMEWLAIRQRVGQRLMSELPPAQGATLRKRLFI